MSSDEREYYVVYPKRRGLVASDELDRLIVVAQNSLAEVLEEEGFKVKLVFPDNFQAREFKQKLAGYFPNWTMRRLSRPPKHT